MTCSPRGAQPPSPIRNPPGALRGPFLENDMKKLDDGLRDSKRKGLKEYLNGYFEERLGQDSAAIEFAIELIDANLDLLLLAIESAGEGKPLLVIKQPALVGKRLLLLLTYREQYPMLLVWECALPGTAKSVLQV